MSKRKREDSLAERVLEEKLNLLRGSKSSATKISKREESSHNEAAFSYLLEICLEVERLESQTSSNVNSSKAERAAEETGDYDYALLQTEPLPSATNHASFIGPVTVSALPAPKTQGVVAVRDILKGELLCTSVPSIVVQNLAGIDDLSNLIFSDVSRAEMTAKLILMAESSSQIKSTLESFEFASKDKIIQGDLASLCEAIISKYTWAIDHPSTNPKGRPFLGKYTKVAGHAFTIDGYAGKFNHSCVPNATMVSYGAVQFFRANVNIPQNTEICVAYGFDPLDNVETRRDKLNVHAGFECTCPLCIHQVNIANDDSTINANELSDTISFEDILYRVILGDENWSTQCNDFSKARLVTLSHEAVVVSATLLDDDLQGQYLPRYKDINILQLLLMQARWQALLDRNSVQSQGEADTLIIKHCILLCIMLISLTLPRSSDVGIAYGDFFRTTIQAVAKLITTHSSAQSTTSLHDDHDEKEDYFDMDWWMQKSLEYTDCF